MPKVIIDNQKTIGEQHFSRPNLFVNWYFPTAINQRNLTEIEIPPSTSSSTRTVVDGWASHLDGIKYNFENHTLYFRENADWTGLLQYFHCNSNIQIGDTITFSVLGNVSGPRRLWLRLHDNIAPLLQTQFEEFGLNLYTCQFTINRAYKYLQAQIDGSIDDKGKAGNIELIAAKLEIGKGQTLAYQDDNEDYHLIDPIPDPVLELLRTRRKFIYDNHFGMYSTFVASDYLPVNVKFPTIMDKITDTSFPTVKIFSIKDEMNKISYWHNQETVPSLAVKANVVLHHGFDAIMATSGQFAQNESYSFHYLAESL